MKRYLLIAILSIGTAYADLADSTDSVCPINNIVCQPQSLTLRKESVKGYAVEFKTVDGVMTATLEEVAYSKENKFRTYKTLAELPCRNTVTANPDEPRTIVECRDSTVVDKGYKVELSSPDFAGLQWSTITEDRFAGPKDLGKVPCLK